jgi:hypothetical protein
MLRTYRFPGPRILRVGIAPTGKLGVGFLNWRVSPQPLRERGALAASFTGCGLYGVCFRGRLVYVGSYCGKKPLGARYGAYFTGDVARSRWWAHFGSLTARGHKVHVARRVLADLRDDLGDHPMLLAFAKAGPAIHTDAGCLGAENRLRFAARHWIRFTSTPAARLLKQFSFLYVREDGSGIVALPINLERAIEAAETEAISAMQPEVNTAQRDRTAIARSISPRKALSALEEILSRHLQQYRQRPD